MKHVESTPVMDRAVGSMVAMALGDWIGCWFEFLPMNRAAQHGGSSKLCIKTLHMEGTFNKFRLQRGQWTDDTSMALCMADSLLVCEGYNGTDIRARFYNWVQHGYN